MNEIRMDNNMTLTAEDRSILESYTTIVDGLAAYLGNSFEIALHSLEDMDHSVIRIANGFHTGRTVGSPITDLALYILEQIKTNPDKNGYHVYFSKNKLGEPLKSTTIAIKNNQGTIIGLLCINLFLGTPLIHFMTDLVPPDISVFAAEHATTNPNLTIQQELENAREAVLNDPSILPSLRNREIIRILQSKRIFDLKNSIEQVANALDISINTVYFHLRKIAKQDGGGIEK